ncbi:MAG: nicotinate-nicotinamide nucleotide adenylyltransferase [Mariprofundaceae bacterium]
MIGIFGGSFDPPHCGHLALVRAGLDRLGLDEVWVLPAWPVHRQLSGCADADQRLRWLTAMFADEPRVRVLDREIRKGRPTPSIETLREFAAERTGEIPWLMLGADAWAGLPDWREYPAHRKLCNIVMFARQGSPMVDVPGWQRVGLKDASGCRTPGHVLRLDVNLPDVSATEIRAACSQGRIPDGMIPDIILADVKDLYGGQ